MIKVDELLMDLIEKNRTPSVQYVLFNKDSVIHSFKGGFADIKNQRNIEKFTTYHIFSVTKTFTALAVLQLAEAKKLDIDDSVKQYLPHFPYAPDITIRQLLTHTAGIPNPNPLNWIHLSEEDQNFNRNAFFDRIFSKHNKTTSRPNEKFSYSNLGYVLLGQLIEKVSGMGYENYIRKYILQALNISPKELDFEIFGKNQHARGYQKQFSFLNLVLGFFIDKAIYMDKPEGSWKPFREYYVNGASYGGLIGNSTALIKYVQELLKPNCKLLSKDYKKLLFSENYTLNKKATGMCLSWFTGDLNGNKYFTHAGGGGGYYCELRLYPDLETGSVILFNRTGVKDERFLDKVDIYHLVK